MSLRIILNHHPHSSAMCLTVKEFDNLPNNMRDKIALIIQKAHEIGNSEILDGKPIEDFGNDERCEGFNYCKSLISDHIDELIEIIKNPSDYDQSDKETTIQSIQNFLGCSYNDV